MTIYPEHAKVEALKATNQLAGNLAFLLLDSDHWTLSNHRSEPVIDIQVQRVVSDILSIDFPAYQAERVALLGLSAPNLGVVAKVIGWSAAEPLPTVDEVVAASAEQEDSHALEAANEGTDHIDAATPDEANLIAAVAQQDAAEDDITELTSDEASLIAGFAHADDAAPAAEPVAFVPGDENGELGEPFYFSEEDSFPADGAAPVGAEDELVEEAEEAEEAEELAGAELDAEPSTELAAEEPIEDEPAVDGDEAKAAFIETGTYSLIRE